MNDCAAWSDGILLRLPRSVRARYAARLVRRAYGFPGPVVLAGMTLVIMVHVFIGAAAVAGVVNALAPWGPRALPTESLPALLFLGIIVLPLAGSCITALMAYRRLRHRLLRSQLQVLGGTARLRTCPNCAYDQSGTPGVLCPECGCMVAFPTEAPAGEALALGSRCSFWRWRVVFVFVLPGAAAGLAGLLAFGAAHAALIAPIWGRLAGGWPFALLGGIAIAWAFHALLRAGTLRGRFGDAFRLGALLWAGLLPMNAFGLLVEVMQLESALGPWEVVIEVGLALACGIVMGWLLSRRRSAAAALGAATLALGLASGGPIALSTIGGAAIFAWMLPICIFAVIPVVAVRRAAAAA